MRGAILLVSLLVIPRSAPESALFTPATGSPVKVGPGSGTVILADINLDGHLDLLTRHLLGRVIVLQIGNGRGGFAASPRSPMVLDYEPGDMAVGDFNNDGTPDLAVTPGRLDIVDVFLGTGTGDFLEARGSPFTVTDATEELNKRTLHLLDINEDGNTDIVTANGRRRNTFAMLFGDGRGGFTRGPEVAVDTGRDRYSIAFGDFNGDRHVDVVSTSRAGYDDKNPGRVIVRLGDGKGGFRESAPRPFFVPAGPRATVVADLNTDRRPDIAILDAKGLLSVLLNGGKGTFAPAPGSPFDLAIDSHFPAIVDVNADAKLDLVAPTVDSVSVFLGDGRKFTPASGSPFRAGPGAYHAGIADVNGDGKPDIAAASFEGDAVTLLLRR